MPARGEITYFGAGPAGLPTRVLTTAAASLLDYESTGLGLAEHSHRSSLAASILNGTKADLATYLDIPSDYEILFMQGGGSGQFSATLYNFVGMWVERRRARLVAQGYHADGVAAELERGVREELRVDYVVTGSWSLKASQEAARLLGPEHVNIVADAREGNGGKFGNITAKEQWKLSKDAAMVYYCDNETVDGVEFPSFPKVLEGEDTIVVADMSSNILSRRIPIAKYDLIFFGAQKNLGTTGITVVIMKKSLLPPHLATPEPSLMRKLGLPLGPIVLDYATIAKNNSLYNTLSIFDVYIAGLVLKQLLQTYPDDKVDGQQKIADAKAALLYEVLDGYADIYKVVPDKSARSRMNICFNLTCENAEAEKMFLDGATALGLLGLKGHRSVGGIRASNYNSVSVEGATALAEYLKDFARRQEPKR